jgi:hypothetical protein
MCFSYMCLCNFGALFGQYVSLLISCNLAVSGTDCSAICLCFPLSCRIRVWQSVASVDILVSVDAADSIAAQSRSTS